MHSMDCRCRSLTWTFAAGFDEGLALAICRRI
jgi:hypothetical protein